MSLPRLRTRERLSEVRYEIRGELARRALELEAQGRKLINLNIGNPGAFGFRAPEHLQQAIAGNLPATDPYTHQQGLPSVREVIATPGWPPVAIPGQPGWWRHWIDGQQVDLPHRNPPQ